MLRSADALGVHGVIVPKHHQVGLTGAAAKTLGYTEAPDPDPTKPYMMWAGTPYEHAMVPIGARGTPGKMAAMSEMKDEKK